MRSRSDAKKDREKKTERNLEAWQIEVPNDPINEQVLLSAMALDADVRKRLVKQFKPETFFAEKHRAIFAGLQELERQGLEFDPAVLARLSPNADIRLIEQIVDGRGELPANLEFHVDTLLWDNKRAEVTEGPLAAMIEALQNPRETPDRVRALARNVGAAFEETTSRAPFLRDRKEVVREMMANLRARIAGAAYYPFGIEGLDYGEDGVRRLRPGAAPGLVTVFTGMSGSGKTTLSAHAILGIARRKRRVLVGAWEVRAPMTLELITTLALGWSRSKILDGKTNRVDSSADMDQGELVLFEETAHRISKKVTFVENPFRRGSFRTEGKVTNDDYLDILEQHIEASGADCVLLDLFDRCLRYRKPDDEQEALWRVAEMTESYQVHMMLVHQNLIKGENVRKDMKPSLAGLKGSSAYVDIAAAIIAPHIPARFKNVPNNKFEVYGLKCRFADPFGVEFDWNADTGQIWGGRSMSMDEAMWGDSEEGGMREGALKPGERRPGAGKKRS